LVINSTQQQILVPRLTYKIVNALAITSPLPQGVRYMAADCGYDDDHKLYDLSITRGFELLCRYRKYTITLAATDYAWYIFTNPN
jgi:hypothetical protein